MRTYTNERYGIKLYNGDCLDVMTMLEDKSIDLICIDPPYNINKAKWDTWKTVDLYVEFMGNVFKQCEQMLKDNGSFYFFHNDFEQIAELQYWLKRNTGFIFKQFIIWNKRFEGGRNKGYLDGYVAIGQDRNYRLMAEYCLFYTFQDATGRKLVDHDINNYVPLREYFRQLQGYIGFTKTDILQTIGQQADHCFRHSSTQWSLPTMETYQQLIDKFNIDKWEGFRKYEELRLEYEELRYTFNNQKTHHSVWNYEIAKSNGHITPKPVDLIENITRHSSNEGNLVLDCFMGSGTTGVACINTDRHFIGIELDDHYFDVSVERIEKAIKAKESQPMKIFEVVQELEQMQQRKFM